MASFRPTLEVLEGRELMSATHQLLSNGTLVVNCDGSHDTVRVRQTTTQIVLNNQVAYDVRAVARVVVYGNGGNDTLDAIGVAKPVSLFGGSGNDYLVGGNNRNVFRGGMNNDTIFGGPGNDVIHGDSGDDRLFGQTGYDYLYGGSGNDFLDDGLRGANEFYNSGSGADFIADAWTVQGTRTSDIVQGQAGTCAFLSGLAAGCDAGIDYSQWIVYQGPDANGMGIYDVKLWNTGTRQYYWTRIGFDGTTNAYDTKTATTAWSRVAEFEFWPVLLQRAYIQTVNSTKFGVGIATATGGLASHVWSTGSNAKNALLQALAAHRPVTAAIDHNTLYGITDHALTVVEARGSAANPWLLIYNPWGRDGRSSSGLPAAIHGGNDGYFWVSWNTFRTHFDGGFYIR